MKNHLIRIIGTIGIAAGLLLACSSDNTAEPPVVTEPPVYTPGTEYPQIKASFDMPEDKNGGRILDFSRVGYRWGDEALPTVAVVETLTPPANGADAYELIQGAIDKVAALPLSGNHRGAILLKAGTYNVSQDLRIASSGIVLRGEGSDPGNGTLIRGTGTRYFDPNSATSQNLITIGGSGGRTGSKPASPNVRDSYVPEGRFWVRVNNPKDFSKMDNVVVYRPSTDEWVRDLAMSTIWKASDVDQMYAERVITKISGDTLWFENPIPCSIETKYGGGYVYKYSYNNRIQECGVENMALESEWFGEDNESHCWNGISFTVAQHCWVKNVTGRYFGFGLVMIRTNAKNITVRDCVCTEPQSTLGGSRRYPFFHGGQLSIFMNCNSEDARHPYATSGSNTVGPNVFSGGEALRNRADAGPHRHWSQGTLYENLKVEGAINIRNRYDNGGDGHGWAGTNEVAWNCVSTQPIVPSPQYGFIVQSPHVSGQNYAVGCTGIVRENTFDRNCSPPSPDGHWISHGTPVSPASLYEAQLALRKITQPGGVFDVK